MLAAALLLLSQPADPWPTRYVYPTVSPGDHLLPVEDVFASGYNPAYMPLVVRVLNVPSQRRNESVLVWSFTTPSFKPEEGMMLVRSHGTRAYRLRGARAVTSIWSTYARAVRDDDPDMSNDVLAWFGPERVPASVITAVEDGTDIEGCEAALDDDLAVGLADGINARLAKTRAGLEAGGPDSPVNIKPVGGQSYYLGGVSMGRTTNGRQGPDIDRVRAAADAAVTYCFEKTPLNLDRVEDAVRALEIAVPR